MSNGNAPAVRAKAEPKWHRRKAARRGEILIAAAAIFAQKGFQAARMEDIAAAAGITKGTIYLYFAGKAEMFRIAASADDGENFGQESPAPSEPLSGPL